MPEEEECQAEIKKAQRLLEESERRVEESERLCNLENGAAVELTRNKMALLPDNSTMSLIQNKVALLTDEIVAMEALLGRLYGWDPSPVDMEPLGFGVFEELWRGMPKRLETLARMSESQRKGLEELIFE